MKGVVAVVRARGRHIPAAAGCCSTHGAGSRRKTVVHLTMVSRYLCERVHAIAAALGPALDVRGPARVPMMHLGVEEHFLMGH